MPDDPSGPPPPPADPSPMGPSGTPDAGGPADVSAPSPPPAAGPPPADAPAAAPIPAPVETVAPPVDSAPAAAPPAPPAPPISPPPASLPPPYPVAPAAAIASGVASRYGPPPPVHHLLKAPRPLSTLPQQLRKLAYIVSIVMGGSAILAGVWSAFLLPLLHATCSARNAIASAQKDRWATIREKLAAIRSLGIFPLPLTREEAEERAHVIARIEREKAEKAEKAADDEKLALQRTRSPDSPRSASISLSHTDDIPPSVKPPPLPMRADTADLTAALRDLAANLDATATTRTSLVSTLEGYTSGLHRELFLARGSGPSTPWGPVPGATTGRVGLGTLSANLANAGGKVSSGSPGEASPLGIPPARSEEWDNVRREVRAIKGLVLNRRNFSVPARAA